MGNNLYIGKTVGSFIIILLLMPLGHALMAIMEHILQPTTLHYAAFAMGFAGMVMVIIGVYVKGDTKQTIWGITGAMLFWTGWIEFLFVYYAQRYGVHCDLQGTGAIQTTTTYTDGMITAQDYLINGRPLTDYTRPELKAIRGSRPEYLIMPATFGMWMTIMIPYIFCTRTGCDLLNWIQRHILHTDKNRITIKPMAHHSSIVVFMEWIVMMWGLYLVLMFCYDPVFLGERHPITLGFALVCLVGSMLMIKKQLHIASWGRNIRFALATVIVFWSFVEIAARNGFFNEVWTDPLNHTTETVIICIAFIAVIAATVFFSRYISTEDTYANAEN
jgi:hypothetical protein